MSYYICPECLCEDIDEDIDVVFDEDDEGNTITRCLCPRCGCDWDEE